MTGTTNNTQNTGSTEGTENTENLDNTDDQPSMTPGRWMRAAAYRRHTLMREYAAALGDTAREGVSDEDYATTMATLEQMARNLGWDESQGEPGWGPRGPWSSGAWGRGGRGHGHGHGHATKAERQARKKAAKKASQRAK